MVKPTLSSIGSLVKSKRGGKGIREVAREVGISPATLSRIENGKIPDLNTFSKLCSWLKLDAGEILGCSIPKEAGTTSDEDVISVHLRAERVQDPEIAEALTEMIIKAHTMLTKQHG